MYRGENAVHKFISLYFSKDMILTKDDEQNFKKADKYYICNTTYSTKDVRVRDHCHITGKYRGSAHQNSDKIPVIVHNLKVYDSHFIMQTIGEIASKHTYKNKKGEEKHMDIMMAFMIGKHLVFIDSLQLMSSSLDKLVRNLPNDAFKYTSEEIQNGKKAKLYETKRCISL